MPKKLTSQEYATLIAQYKSDLSVLEFQVSTVKDTLKQLQKDAKAQADAEKAAAPKRRRGRPAKAKTPPPVTAPKRRGRPPKAKTEAVATAPKRRGRPPKVKTEAVATAPKRRGRPPKVKTEEVVSAPKRRGRPPKSKTEAVATAPKRRGRPPKAKTAPPAAPKRRGRPPKAKSEAPAKSATPAVGYRLNEWDEFIINTIRKKKKVVISADLLKLGRKKLKKDGAENVDELELRARLNRSLHKLANKHGRLIKTDYPGKGHAYGLADWKDESGKLDEKYTG